MKPRPSRGAVLLAGWALFALPSAFAAHVDRWVADEGTERRYHVVWEDAEQRRRDTVFTLPIAAVQADALADETLTVGEVSGARAAAVRAWAETLPRGSSVTVQLRDGPFRYVVRAPDDAARARLHEGVEAAARAGSDALFATVGYVRGEDDRYRVDLPRLVSAYAEPLRPLATALSEPGDDARDFATRALAFVQDIPFEARRVTTWGDPVLSDDETFATSESVGYVGFRRPLALLDEDRGDCDGKTVLYLALVRAAWPEVPLAAVRIPGHVYGGVALDGWGAGASFTHDGARYVVTEPAGPGRRAPGTYQKSSVGVDGTVYPVPPS